MDHVIVALFTVFILGAGAGCLLVLVVQRRHARPAPHDPQTFKESEEQFRLIFDLAPISLSITGPDGRYVRINQSFCDLIGYSKDEVLGLRFQDITHPDDLDLSLELLKKLQNQEVSRGEIEKRYIRKDGQALDALTRISVIRDAAGRPFQYIGQIVDIRERKKIQRKLEQQREVLKALNETSLALMNRLDLPDLLEAILSRASALLNSPNGVIYLIDPDKQALIRIVRIGLFTGYAGVQLKYGEGLAGKVWQSGQTLSIADYSSWPERLPDPELDALRALIGVPLKSGDQVVGVLSLGRYDEGRIFDSDEMVLLSRFAELASIALDNARLYTSAQQELAERKRAEEQLRRQNEYLMALHETTLALINRLDLPDLLEAILSRAAALGGTRDGYIYLVEADGEQMAVRIAVGRYKQTIGRSIGYGEGLSGRVWQAGEPLLVDDYAAWPGRVENLELDDAPHAMVGVPLRSGGQVVGVLSLSHSEENRTFSADEVLLLSRFAELASIALDNARLYTSAQQELGERKRAEEQLRRQNEYLTALNETTVALINRLDLTDLLKTIIISAGTLIGTSDGYIYFTDKPDANEMVLEVGTGYHTRDIGYRMKRGAGFSGKVWETGELLAINNYFTWPDRLPDPELDPLRALVGMPLKSGDQVIGVLGLSRLEEGSTFGEEEIRLLYRFAELASIALDNARLYTSAQQELAERKRVETQLRRQNEYFAALNATTLALINRLDLTDLLDAILARAAALMGTSDGCIYLAEPGGDEVTMKLSTGFFNDRIGFRLKLSESSGLAAKVFRTGLALAVNDYATWAERSREPGLELMQAAVAAPLKSGSQVVGVLSLGYFEVGRSFGDDEVALLSRFAELASIAYDNARLYASAQQELAERTRAEENLWALNADLERRVQERTAQLQHERALLQTILGGIGEGVIYSRFSMIQYTNHALSELTGYQPEELIGQAITLLRSANTSEQALHIFSDEVTMLPWRGETSLRRKDGSEFNAALVATQIVEPDSAFPGVIIIVRDITEEKQLQSQKSRFIANASHELRTPLTNLKTRLYLLRRQPEQSADHARALENVTDRMISLVEDLLDVTRFERGVISLQRQQVVVQSLIEDVIRWQEPEAARKHISLIAEQPDQAVRVSGDRTRLMQVILNLTVNAINYTPSGGCVTIQLLTERDGYCSYGVVRVCDTGIGIAPEHLQRVFEPFFRANEGASRGTGLGLSIAKEIVDLHGGLLTVESEPGKGSTFSVRLPLVDAPLPANS